MRKIFHIIRKEFLQLLRDPRLFPVIFLSPIIQLFVLGYAANLDVRNIPVVVSDMDRSQTSREFLARFENSGYFHFQGRAAKPNEVDRWLDHGHASMAIVVPRRFGSDLTAGKTVQIQLIMDGAESQSAIIGFSYASMIVAKYSRDILLQTLGRSGLTIPGGGLNHKVRVWYNPDLKSRNFFVPGVLATLLMIMTMLLTSQGIVKEKEMGTMEQLIVTPVRPWQLILGKLLPFLIIGLVDIALVVIVATFWFKVPVKGSVPLLFALGVVFMMTTLGLGLFISTISRNQQQAMMTSSFFMMPQILLSGFVFPLENMPSIIQAISTIIPLRYFLVIIRGLFLKGVGIEALWDETVALLVFGLAILTLSTLLFRKKLG